MLFCHSFTVSKNFTDYLSIMNHSKSKAFLQDE